MPLSGFSANTGSAILLSELSTSHFPIVCERRGDHGHELLFLSLIVLPQRRNKVLLFLKATVEVLLFSTGLVEILLFSILPRPISYCSAFLLFSRPANIYKTSKSRYVFSSTNTLSNFHNLNQPKPPHLPIQWSPQFSTPPSVSLRSLSRLRQSTKSTMLPFSTTTALCVSSLTPLSRLLRSTRSTTLQSSTTTVPCVLSLNS
jgi:hypothetical protein